VDDELGHPLPEEITIVDGLEVEEADQVDAEEEPEEAEQLPRRARKRAVASIET
jgi:hypothetical protein